MNISGNAIENYKIHESVEDRKSSKSDGEISDHVFSEIGRAFCKNHTLLGLHSLKTGITLDNDGYVMREHNKQELPGVTETHNRNGRVPLNWMSFQDHKQQPNFAWEKCSSCWLCSDFVFLEIEVAAHDLESLSGPKRLHHGFEIQCMQFCAEGDEWKPRTMKRIGVGSSFFCIKCMHPANSLRFYFRVQVLDSDGKSSWIKAHDKRKETTEVKFREQKSCSLPKLVNVLGRRDSKLQWSASLRSTWHTSFSLNVPMCPRTYTEAAATPNTAQTGSGHGTNPKSLAEGREKDERMTGPASVPAEKHPIYLRRDATDERAANCDLKRIKGFDDALKAILKSNFASLRRIFKKFCCSNAASSNPFLMDPISCVSFLSVCKLVDFSQREASSENSTSPYPCLTQEEFQSIFVAHELSRHEFLILLLKLAMHIFEEKQDGQARPDSEMVEPGNDSATRRFAKFIAYIIECAGPDIREKSMVFQESFKNREVLELLLENEDPLQKAFANATSHSKRMSFLQYHTTISRYLSEVSKEDIMISFVESAPVVRDEIKTDKHRYLNYHEFLEALARLCHACLQTTSPTTELPSAMKSIIAKMCRN